MTKARDIADFKFEDIVDTGTEGTKVASGTTAQRGSTTGQWRFNTTTGYFEGRNNAGEFSTLEPTPTITSVDVTEIDSNAGGNQTIVVSGTNFSSGGTIAFVGTSATFDATTTTYDNATQVTAVAPKASFLNAQEPYKVKFSSASGVAGVSATGLINVDSAPSWTTNAGSLGTAYEDESANITVAASDADGDTVSYSETTSNVLGGAGLSLNSSTGVISGNPNDVTNDTTLNFTLRATAGSKTADRSFSIIVANPPLDGSSSARAGTSASAIKTLTNTTTSGLYWITVGGTPRQIYCDMSGFNSTGYMLMATMKDAQSGWSGSSSSSTATNNINNYTNWGYDSNWWTSATGEADIVADDYDFTNNRDYKSYLWSNYSVDNSNQDAFYLVNGNALNTAAKRVRVGGSFTSSTLVNVFNGTTSIGGDNANNNNTGSGWNFNGGSGTSTQHGTAQNTKNINVGRTNWVYGYYRIAAYSSSDSVLYGSSIASGAGIKYVHQYGSDNGGKPANDYTMNSDYTTGISMTLWVK